MERETEMLQRLENTTETTETSAFFLILTPLIYIRHKITEPIPVDARPKWWVCWDFGFESRVRHVCLSLVSSVFMCVFSGTGLWVGLIARPEKTYRVWCICA